METNSKIIDYLLSSLITFPILLTIFGCAFRSPKVIEQLRDVEEVTGRTIGVAGIEGEFYKLSLKLIKKGDRDQLIALLDDINPVSRAMGLVCLAQLDFEHNLEILEKFFNDSGVIEFIPNGSDYSTITIGELAKMLSESPNILGHSNNADQRSSSATRKATAWLPARRSRPLPRTSKANEPKTSVRTRTKGRK
jgi:hypothetical protein